MKTTKKDLIRQHLLSGEKITSLEAIHEYGVTRLSAIIFDLRREGMYILSHEIDVPDRFGNNCRVAQYRYVNEGR